MINLIMPACLNNIFIQPQIEINFWTCTKLIANAYKYIATELYFHKTNIYISGYFIKIMLH